MIWFIPRFVPDLLQVFPFVLVFALACAKVLRENASVFYLLWGLVVALVSIPDLASGITGSLSASPEPIAALGAAIELLRNVHPAVDSALNLLTSAVTGVSMYLIVMFIGAMRKGPRVRRLYSVRSELSILGGIIVLGHCLRVLPYLAFSASPLVLNAFGIPGGYFMMGACGIVGIPLLVCFLVPWVTSFPQIRHRMGPKRWKRVQKLAYPFMVLMLLQGLCLALAHALYGLPLTGASSAPALLTTSWACDFAKYVATAWTYATLLVAYPVLKLIRRSERREKEGARHVRHAKSA